MVGQDESWDTVKYESSGIPHGHGLSFKKGLVDGLRERESPDSNKLPEGHDHSYDRGLSVGKDLRQQITGFVRK